MLSKNDALKFIANLMSEEEAVGDVTSLATSRSRHTSLVGAGRIGLETTAEEQEEQEDEASETGDDSGDSSPGEASPDVPVSKKRARQAAE